MEKFYAGITFALSFNCKYSVLKVFVAIDREVWSAYGKAAKAICVADDKRGG